MERSSKLFTILMFVVAIATGCGGGGSFGSPPEIENRKAYEHYTALKEEMKTKVPLSEIVGQVRGGTQMIHKFHDETTGATCYFMEYSSREMSCVK